VSVEGRNNIIRLHQLHPCCQD